MLYVLALCSGFAQNSHGPPLLRSPTSAPGPSSQQSAHTEQASYCGGTRACSLSTDSVFPLTNRAWLGLTRLSSHEL